MTIATPWLGAPKTIYTLETGEFLDWKQHLALVSQEDLKSIVGSFKGAMQLLPSQAYFDIVDKQNWPVVEDGWDFNGNGNPYDQTPFYGTIKNALDRRFGREGFLPGSTGNTFHSNIAPQGAQDDWSGGKDTTSVRYYHIWGQQPRDETIGSIITQLVPLCERIPTASDTTPACRYFEHMEPKYTKGDGTVPRISARRESVSKPVNYNVSSAVVVQAERGNQGHVELPSNPDVQNKAIQYLSGLTEAASQQSRSTTRSLAAQARQSQSLSERTAAVESDQPSLPARYLTLIGASGTVVTDAAGHSTATISPDAPDPQIAGFTAYGFGTNDQSLIMDTTQTYTVTFQTTNTPLLIEVRTGTGDTTTELIRYRDITLPPNVAARLSFTPQGVENLRYDRDGDGAFESVVAPTTQVSGALAADRDAPTISVSQSVQAIQTRITLSAQDAGSGVRAIYYTLDGTRFQLYTGPFTVNPVLTPRISVFADDNVGNRASWREITVKGLTVAPVHPILECVANNGDGTYTAYFGYQNANAFVVTIPVGPDNKFSPNPENRSQPSVFQSGRSSSYPNAAFSVVFDGNQLVWTLWDRTATASRTAKACS